MEAVEEPPLHNPSVDSLKIGVVSDTSAGIVVTSEETNVCHKSNGVSDATVSGEAATIEGETVKIQDKLVSKTDTEKSGSEEKSTPSASDSVSTAQLDSAVVDETTPHIEKSVEAGEEVSQTVEESKDTEEMKIQEIVIETTVDQVTFETEIVVESNDGEVLEETIIEQENTNNILSELGESIELSEALRSSDVTDNVENNNCGARQEVFNKEELLDILEGNDDQTDNVVTEALPPPSSDRILDSQKALEQLSRLKTNSKKSRSFTTKTPKKRMQKFIVVQNNIIVPEVKGENDNIDDENVGKDGGGNIVKDLVKDWDDEDGAELDKSNSLVDDNDTLSQSSSDTVIAQGSINKQDEVSIRTSVDSQPADGKLNSDESQPQRRLGRVIKKKVIFDPDNPDTFTKSKQPKSKDNVQEKDQTPIKKIKSEPGLLIPKSKSPITKLQWKKPSPKNIKQNKRLSEVDRLLMDEGAVNMIYQLTPEAPKGKGKNMRSKAEIIKKIQSSETPDTKEMKFRERKKESKYEEGEAKKILGVKHRPSLSSSVKSPCVSEDFEAHSADDSIIYRRHSSSSYSSSCMSPRRLSDVEMTSQVPRTPQAPTNQEVSSENTHTIEIFIPDSAEVIRPEIINKDDCMSIKEKLNSKLNLALKKRKRENSKIDKPLKQKKVKTEENNMNNDELKYITVTFDERVAVICVQKSTSVGTTEIIRELEKALKIIDSRKDISVTLLLSEWGTAYSQSDLKSLLDENKEQRTTHAFKLAESVRSLFQTISHHSKLLCSAASGRCTGVALGIIALSDIALASERASFGITAKTQSSGPIEPGTSVLTSYCNLSEPALTDLVVLGRRMSASDALKNGLLSRVLWPENFNEQVLTVAKEIAAQPAQNIWLKKQMLKLKRSGSESTFLNCLEKERDTFVEYWTSAEGQVILRTTYSA